MKLINKNKQIDLSTTQIMGILNVTPDSFSDGGMYNSLDKALFRCQEMIEQGASIIDIGGESTRPGAMDVSTQEQMDRVCPVVEKIAQNFDTFISVDTSDIKVIEQCSKLGCNMWNDIRALSEKGAIDMAASLGLVVCIMHMQGQPRSMQNNPVYTNVVDEVYNFLMNKAQECQRAGISKDNIIIDVGFGFGKTLDHNYELLANLDKFVNSGYVVLSALSRKSMIRGVLNVAGPLDTIIGSVSGALLSAIKGAQIVRVHDVKQTSDALKVYSKFKEFVK